MKAAVDRTTFAAGEVSPELYARTDLAKHASAIRRCENFVVLLEGGVTRRPGTQFIAPLRTESEAGRLIRFSFGAGDSYGLVFNGGKIRFTRDGGVIESSPGVPYEINQPYLAADLPFIRASQVGNLMFLACRRPGTLGYQPQVLQRLGHTNWTLVAYANKNGPIITMNTDKGLTIEASGFTVGASITLTANTARFTPDDIGRMYRLDEQNYETVRQWVKNESISGAGVQRRHEGNIYAANQAGAAGTNPPIHIEGTYADGIEGGGGYGTSVGWTYLHSGYGFVIITAVGGNPSATATATVLTRLPDSVNGGFTGGPTYRWWIGAWSPADGWPETVRTVQGRLSWSLDDFFWMTKPADFFDFDITLYPDSALSGRITSEDGEKVDIRWQMAAGVLVFGTASTEMTIRGQSSFDAITIEGIRPIVEDTNGSAHHEPARVDEGIVFLGQSRTRLHFGRFDKIGESLTMEEITVTASHILKPGAIALAYQRDPHRIVWAATEDGGLRGITFMPRQDVRGWHRHSFINGFVEDIATVPHAGEKYDELHLIVRRTINSATRRYVEILRPFFEPIEEEAPTALGAWFVDSGLAYSGTPITNVSGLQHLAGETVRIFCDGAQRPDGVVSVGGMLTISPASGDIVIGLPMVSRVKSLDMETDAQTGVSKGRQKQSRFIFVQRVKSIGGAIRSNQGELEDLDPTGTLMYGAPLPLGINLIPITVDSPTDVAVVLELVCDNALPFTLAGWTPDIEMPEEA